MSTTLQIRNLPPELHRAIKIRAAEEGVSMSEWVTRRLRDALARPSMTEVLARLDTHEPVPLTTADPLDAIRQVRGDTPVLLAADSGTARYSVTSDPDDQG